MDRLFATTLGAVPFVLALFAAVLVGLSIRLFGQRNAGRIGPLLKNRTQITMISGAFLELALWLGIYAAELSFPGQDATILAHRLIYIPVATFPPTLLAASLCIQLNRPPTRRLLATLFSIPSITVALSLTNAWQGWLWSPRSVVPLGELSAVKVDHGPWFLVHTAYCYGTLLVTYTILLHRYLLDRRRRLMEIVALTAAFSAPIAANFAHLFIVFDQTLDITPLALSVTILTVSWLFSRDWIQEMIPFAWMRAIDELGDAVLLVDDEDHVFERNEAGANFVVQARGDATQDRMKLTPELALLLRGERSSRVMVVLRDSMRHYDVRIHRLALDVDSSARVLAIRDVSELSASRHQIRRLEYWNPSTRLPNRRATLRHIEGLVEAESSTFALLILAIDRFARVNETYGRAAGDDFEAVLAATLSSAMQAADAEKSSGPGLLLTHLGAGEFAILAPSSDPHMDAERLAGQIWTACDRPVELAGELVYGTVTIGIALFPQHGTTAGKLMRAADNALCEAQRSRARWSIYDTARQQPAISALRIEADLRRAIQEGNFVLLYQPILCARTGRVVAAEALLRWRKNDGDLISAGTFIDVAEETGLVIPIGSWTLTAAAQQIRTWRNAGLVPPRICLNISSLQIANPEFPEEVRDTIAKAGIEASDLEIELTERVVFDHGPRANAALAALDALGVGLSLDDFGTGYSSLSYLHRLPIDRLKIDISFVRELDREPAARRLTRAIIEMSHGLGMKVIAEGVEEPAQAEWLTRHECDELQGYLFWRPMPAEDFRLLLARHPGEDDF